MDAETQNEPQTLRDLKAAGDELEPEAKQVFEFRRDELRKLGYTQHEAVEIAYTAIDLAQLRDLIRRGATIDLAYRILAGTDFLGDELDTSRLYSPSEKKKRAKV